MEQNNQDDIKILRQRLEQLEADLERSKSNTPKSETPSDKPQKSLAVAFILWAVFGVFGFHRLYFERVSGLLQAVFGIATVIVFTIGFVSVDGMAWPSTLIAGVVMGCILLLWLVVDFFYLFWLVANFNETDDSKSARSKAKERVNEESPVSRWLKKE